MTDVLSTGVLGLGLGDEGYLNKSKRAAQLGPDCD